MPTAGRVAPTGSLLLLGSLVVAPVDRALAQEPAGESSEVATHEEPATTDEDQATEARFGPEYPVRFARRPLVLDEGMIRGDARLTVGGLPGSSLFSSLDIGGAISPIEDLEVGLSTELTGAVPAPGGISLISVIFSPTASYGDIPVYGRYRFVESETASMAVDLILVLPANTDFTITAALPLRIVELFGVMTIDMGFGIRYRNGDRYAPFIPDPSKHTADFTYSGGAIANITDHGYVEIGGGVGVVNVGGGVGAENVVEIPFFLGGGYTHDGKVLVDIFSQFGFQPLMTANGPPGRSTFNAADDWYVTIGAAVHSKPLFGKHKN